MQLALNQRPHLMVGALPRSVAEHFRCHPAIVYLGHKELAKIAEGHSEIKHEEFQLLPLAIKDGTYIKDKKRPNCTAVFYAHNETAEIYQIGLKTTLEHSEVWVSTYHRTTIKKAERRARIHGLISNGNVDVSQHKK